MRSWLTVGALVLMLPAIPTFARLDLTTDPRIDVRLLRCDEFGLEIGLDAIRVSRSGDRWGRPFVDVIHWDSAGTGHVLEMRRRKRTDAAGIVAYQARRGRQRLDATFVGEDLAQLTLIGRYRRLAYVPLDGAKFFKVTEADVTSTDVHEPR